MSQTKPSRSESNANRRRRWSTEKSMGHRNVYRIERRTGAETELCNFLSRSDRIVTSEEDGINEIQYLFFLFSPKTSLCRSFSSNFHQFSPHFGSYYRLNMKLAFILRQFSYVCSDREPLGRGAVSADRDEIYEKRFRHVRDSERKMS